MIPTIGDSLIQTAIIPTRTSERQLRRIIKRRGGPSMPFVQTELACYIRFRECSGRTLDTGGQMLRFDDHICLLIGKFQGVWHILSIWWDAEGLSFLPVFRWKIVLLRGYALIARELSGWGVRRYDPIPRTFPPAASYIG